MPYVFTPPTWQNVATIEGALRYSITTCTLVYRQGGVWHNQMQAGMDMPVVSACDTDASGLFLFFDRPVVVPDSLHAELGQVQSADPSWAPATLVPA